MFCFVLFFGGAAAKSSVKRLKTVHGACYGFQGMYYDCDRIDCDSAFFKLADSIERSRGRNYNALAF